MVFNIDVQDAGRTVLSFLKSKLKISSSALTSLKFDESGITVNGSHVTVRYVLRENDILAINEKDSFDDVNETVEAHNIPLDIVFENDDIMVINKPPYMPTHPSHNHTNDTLANAISYLYAQRGLPLVFRPIGRLDRNTSGISLVAKHSISASFLSYARHHNGIIKKYVAILEGKIENDGSVQRIITHMKRMENSVIVRCVSDGDDPDSFEAVTDWRLLYTDEKISVVEATPITGRTHQLRVHFAHIGHPILGDDIYGTPSEHISRHALHAGSLSIFMPYTDDLREFISDPPDDMQEAFKKITNLNFCDILNTESKDKK